jgi:prephenate dehydrogenase
LHAGLEACDLAVLAVPVRDILSILARMGDELPSPRFVMDVGSTKAEIVAAMRRLPREIEPLGGHPLCGKEGSGLPAAEADLFRGRGFVITPLQRSSLGVMQLADELLAALEARPIVIDAPEHDRLLAATSHLPYLMAVALVACADELAASGSRVWEMTASGFRDTSRLAGSDVRMMMGILSTNSAEIEKMLASARAILGDFEAALHQGDFPGLETRLRQARERRVQLGGLQTPPIESRP